MSAENGPKPGVDFDTTDMGDVTHTGQEIMYREQLKWQQRQAELEAWVRSQEDVPLNSYPDEINNRERK